MSQAVQIFSMILEERTVSMEVIECYYVDLARYFSKPDLPRPLIHRHSRRLQSFTLICRLLFAWISPINKLCGGGLLHMPWPFVLRPALRRIGYEAALHGTQREHGNKYRCGNEISSGTEPQSSSKRDNCQSPLTVQYPSATSTRTSRSGFLSMLGR